MAPKFDNLAYPAQNIKPTVLNIVCVKSFLKLMSLDCTPRCSWRLFFISFLNKLYSQGKSKTSVYQFKYQGTPLPHYTCSVKHGAFNTCKHDFIHNILNGNNHISVKISFGPAVRGEGGEAGERKLVGVPKLHSWSKCIMPLMNIQSHWMSNTCHCHMNPLLCILRCSSTLETPSNMFMLFLQY